MDPKLKHIVEISDLLTQAEIKNYTSGVGLSQAERYRIELKITNNPANQDLLDAFAQHPNLFKGYDHFIDPLNDHGIEYLIAFTSLLFMICLAVFTFYPKTPPVQVVKLDKAAETIVVEKFERILPEPITSEINNLENTNPKADIEYKAPTVHEVLKIELLESKSLNLIESNTPEGKALNIKRKYPSVYVGKFKTTDYRKIRIKESPKQLELTGIAADIENTDTLSMHDHFDRIPVAYIKQLKVILKHFQNQNFEETIKAFTQILNDFPNDDNALFYRGLSYYHLDLTELSIRDLKAVMENSMSNFDEEAEWYLALNYQKSGQNQKLKTALEAIINRQAFYAKEAQKRYELCKN